MSRSSTTRSLDGAVITLVHDAGEPWIPAPIPGLIDGLLVHAVDPHDGADIATVVTADAEVNDAAIVYGDLDRVQINTRLRELGIIVREAVQRSPESAALHSPEVEAAVAARCGRG